MEQFFKDFEAVWQMIWEYLYKVFDFVKDNK